MARHAKRDPEKEMMDLANGKPPTTAQEQENRLIILAQKRAELQLLDGTASSQVIAHYLKLGASRERLEQEKIKHETALLSTKKISIESASELESKLEEALKAFGTYQGRKPGD